MVKGIFTQGLAILLTKPVTPAQLASCLGEFEVVKQVEEQQDPLFSGAGLTVAYKPRSNGYVSVDIFPEAWPDSMGHPQENPMLFGAWSMGHFGPLTFPQGLFRAVQQCWSWKEAKTVVPSHTAVIRLRCSYVFGADKDLKVIPADYNAEEELLFLTRMAACFSRLPEALCFFNPNGEVLLSLPAVEESLRYHGSHDLPPLGLWSNIRLFNVNPTWCLMDSVGNLQLDINDHEAAYPHELFSPEDVSRFLRNTTLYCLRKGDVIKNGDTINGPGNRNWQCLFFDTGLSDPPRKVIRWLPCEVPDIPDSLLVAQTAPKPAKKKPFWKIW